MGETKKIEKKVLNFGEKEEEYDSKAGEMLPVWQSPKYHESKAKAEEMINSKKYGLSEADFWILMNKTKTGKMAYTGLIISHNGCLKINDNLDNKVKPDKFTLDKEGYMDSLVYTYCDEDTYEVGEFNISNGKNAYPYAMAFKRCFDRVVLKKSKLAYSGIYSEVEAEEFKKQEQEEFNNKTKLIEMLQKLIAETGTDLEKLKEYYKVKRDIDMSEEQLKEAITQLAKRKGSEIQWT